MSIAATEDQVITVDLAKNPKQFEYFCEVVKTCNKLSNKKKFAYGGAIRGGKTFVTLWILVYLCNRYKGSRWAVIRNTFPSLQKTTIESLKKIINYSPDWKWNQDKGNFFVQNKYGSRIYFMAENLAQDPDLNAFLGLEVNGIFFEQLEELSHKLWDIGLSRLGSWYIENMPPAFAFTTFNPAQTWIKEEIYERWQANTLPADFHFQIAFPQDNAFVTDDQWQNWTTSMTDRYRKQFIEGDWTNFDDKNPRWLYSFDEQRHVAKETLQLLPQYPVNLSFDFNIDPMTCLAEQHSPGFGAHSFIRYFKEFIIPNCTVNEICQQIRSFFPYNVITVTGDATGINRNAGYTSGDETIWTQVKAALKIAPGQYLTPLVNPSMSNSRYITNAMFQHHTNILIDPALKQLIHECKTAKPVKSDNPNFQDKLLKGAGNSDIGFNIFDCLRYDISTHFNNFAQINQS